MPPRRKTRPTFVKTVVKKLNAQLKGKVEPIGTYEVQVSVGKETFTCKVKIEHHWQTMSYVFTFTFPTTTSESLDFYWLGAKLIWNGVERTERRLWEGEREFTLEVNTKPGAGSPRAEIFYQIVTIS